MKSPIIMISGLERPSQAAHHLVARNHTGKHVGSIGARHLPCCQGRRQHRCCRMYRGSNVGVVEIQAMDQRAINQRSCGKRIAFFIRKDTRRAVIHAHSGDCSEQCRRGFGLFSCADRNPTTVGHQQSSALCDRTRKVFYSYLARKLAKCCGDAFFLHECSSDIPRAQDAAGWARLVTRELCLSFLVECGNPFAPVLGRHGLVV